MLCSTAVEKMEVTGNEPQSPGTELNDIWGSADRGYFAYRDVHGDFMISAKDGTNIDLLMHTAAIDAYEMHVKKHGHLAETDDNGLWSF